MKLEVGKTYKTRGGEKVKVVYARGEGKHNSFIVDHPGIGPYYVTSTGEDASCETSYDIVAEDIPTRTYYRAAVYVSTCGKYYYGNDQWYAEKKHFSNICGRDMKVIEWETRELPDLGG